jgi:hypothetical protein
MYQIYLGELKVSHKITAIFCYFNNRHLVPSHRIIEQSIFIPSGVIIFIVGVGNLPICTIKIKIIK